MNLAILDWLMKWLDRIARDNGLSYVVDDHHKPKWSLDIIRDEEKTECFFFARLACDGKSGDVRLERGVVNKLRNDGDIASLIACMKESLT